MGLTIVRLFAKFEPHLPRAIAPICMRFNQSKMAARSSVHDQQHQVRTLHRRYVQRASECHGLHSPDPTRGNAGPDHPGRAPQTARGDGAVEFVGGPLTDARVRDLSCVFRLLAAVIDELHC